MALHVFGFVPFKSSPPLGREHPSKAAEPPPSARLIATEPDRSSLASQNHRPVRPSQHRTSKAEKEKTGGVLRPWRFYSGNDTPGGDQRASPIIVDFLLPFLFYFYDTNTYLYATAFDIPIRDESKKKKSP